MLDLPHLQGIQKAAFLHKLRLHVQVLRQNKEMSSASLLVAPHIHQEEAVIRLSLC